MWILAFERCEGSKAALFAVNGKLCLSFLPQELRGRESVLKQIKHAISAEIVV
jgi:hypothetical protein